MDCRQDTVTTSNCFCCERRSGVLTLVPH